MSLRRFGASEHTYLPFSGSKWSFLSLSVILKLLKSPSRFKIGFYESHSNVGAYRSVTGIKASKWTQKTSVWLMNF